MSKRSDWTFEYTAGKLAEAAVSKCDHHKSRVEWWTAQKKLVMDRIRESGIEIHDSVAEQYTSNRTRGVGPQIVIDATLQRDLGECQGKINEHSDLVKQFDGWAQVLNAHPESRLALDHSDFLFFYGERLVDEEIEYESRPRL